MLAGGIHDQCALGGGQILADGSDFAFFDQQIRVFEKALGALCPDGRVGYQYGRGLCVGGAIRLGPSSGG